MFAAVFISTINASYADGDYGPNIVHLTYYRDAKFDQHIQFPYAAGKLDKAWQKFDEWCYPLADTSKGFYYQAHQKENADGSGALIIDYHIEKIPAVKEGELPKK